MLTQLDRLVDLVTTAGIPNQGVSLSPLRIDYLNASDVQIKTGQQILASFDVKDDTALAAYQQDAIRREAKAAISEDLLLRNLIKVFVDKLNEVINGTTKAVAYTDIVDAVNKCIDDDDIN